MTYNKPAAGGYSVFALIVGIALLTVGLSTPTETAQDAKNLQPEISLTQAHNRLIKVLGRDGYTRSFELGCIDTLTHFAGFTLLDIDPWCYNTYSHKIDELKRLGDL